MVISFTSRMKLVSIHAAQAGCDTPSQQNLVSSAQFQFTQPKRAATHTHTTVTTTARFQFTQPKRAATFVIGVRIALSRVSIHAAQAGCDAVLNFAIWFVVVSIHAARLGCDAKLLGIFAETNVSIHAAQAGCDIPSFRTFHSLISFNSRSPSGLRPAGADVSLSQSRFQFTQPKRAATVAAKIQQKRDSLEG